MSSWPVNKLSETDKKEIKRLTDVIEKQFKQEGYGEWPKDSCGDTCSYFVDMLCKSLGNHGFRWKIVRGWINYNKDQYEAGHVWIESADGTIVDPTAGQFFGGHALRIFPGGDSRYSHKRRW